jgi:hypothetical protein
VRVTNAVKAKIARSTSLRSFAAAATASAAALTRGGSGFAFGLARGEQFLKVGGGEFPYLNLRIAYALAHPCDSLGPRLACLLPRRGERGLQLLALGCWATTSLDLGQGLGRGRCLLGTGASLLLHVAHTGLGLLTLLDQAGQALGGRRRVAHRLPV